MVTTHNLHNPVPPGPRDFFAEMSAQEYAIKSKMHERAISTTEAAKQLNALGGKGWWSPGSCGGLSWTIGGNPLGPLCCACGDTSFVRRLGTASAECRVCPKGNDLAAIISHRREAMKLWEGAEKKTAPTPRDDYHDVTIVSCGGTTTVRPGDVMPTLTGERIRCIEASTEFYNSPAFNRLRSQLTRDAKLITRPRPGAKEEPVPASKTVQGERVTVRVDGVPVGYATGISFSTVPSKSAPDEIDMTAPRRFGFTATAAQPKPDGAATPAPMALRHARMNVKDLRKKLDDARRELRYQRAIAPEGTKRVDGFVSGVKGRKTPHDGAMHVYFDGKRARRVMEAHSGAEGFIIVCEDGNPDARRMKTGIVHVFELTGAAPALPDSLEFAP